MRRRLRICHWNAFPFKRFRRLLSVYVVSTAGISFVLFVFVESVSLPKFDQKLDRAFRRGPKARVSYGLDKVFLTSHLYEIARNSKDTCPRLMNRTCFLAEEQRILLQQCFAPAFLSAAILRWSRRCFVVARFSLRLLLLVFSRTVSSS